MVSDVFVHDTDEAKRRSPIRFDTPCGCRKPLRLALLRPVEEVGGEG
jgi:hypothetical protein